MVFEAPGIGMPLSELGLSAGPDALRGPGGPLPADPADDATLTAEQLAIKQEAERRLAEWQETGSCLASSSIYDGICFFSTGLGDEYTHDAQIGCIPTCYGRDVIEDRLFIDVDRMFEDFDSMVQPDAQYISLLASNCVPRSEGELRIASPDPALHPVIQLS